MRTESSIRYWRSHAYQQGLILDGTTLEPLINIRRRRNRRMMLGNKK